MLQLLPNCGILPSGILYRGHETLGYRESDIRGVLDGNDNIADCANKDDWPKLATPMQEAPDSPKAS